MARILLVHGAFGGAWCWEPVLPGAPRGRSRGMGHRPAGFGRGPDAGVRDGQSPTDLTALPKAAGDEVQANLVVEGDPPVAWLPADAAYEARHHCVDRAVAVAAATKRPDPDASARRR